MRSSLSAFRRSSFPPRRPHELDLSLDCLLCRQPIQFGALDQPTKSARRLSASDGANPLPLPQTGGAKARARAPCLVATQGAPHGVALSHDAVAERRRFEPLVPSAGG